MLSNLQTSSLTGELPSKHTTENIIIIMLSITTFSYTHAPEGQMHLMGKNILQKQFYKGTKAFTIPFRALKIQLHVSTS